MASNLGEQGCHDTSAAMGSHIRDIDYLSRNVHLAESYGLGRREFFFFFWLIRYFPNIAFLHHIYVYIPSPAQNFAVSGEIFIGAAMAVSDKQFADSPFFPSWKLIHSLQSSNDIKINWLEKRRATSMPFTERKKFRPSSSFSALIKHAVSSSRPGGNAVDRGGVSKRFQIRWVRIKVFCICRTDGGPIRTPLSRGNIGQQRSYKRNRIQVSQILHRKSSSAKLRPKKIATKRSCLGSYCIAC